MDHATLDNSFHLLWTDVIIDALKLVTLEIMPHLVESWLSYWAVPVAEFAFASDIWR